MGTANGMKVCLVILMLGFFFIGTGCETGKTGAVGQAKSPEKKNDLNNPCELLSKKEVGAVLKQELEEPKRDDIICTYESVQRSPSVFLNLQLNPVDPAMFMQNRKDFTGKGSFKPVDGIGDNAYFFNGQLNILAKDRGLSMRIEGDQPSEDDLLMLAKKAVERIK
jgi:hypothetical protein